MKTTQPETLRVSVLLAHPDPSSFNHAIAHVARDELLAAGHQVNFHDLYAEGFDPLTPGGELASNTALPPVLKQWCDEAAHADGFVIVHPNWWGQPPAILKGWIDRVLRAHVAYKFVEGDDGEGVPVGLLKARAAIVFNTGNTPLAREKDVFGDPLEVLWKTCIFDLCGVRTFDRRLFGVVVKSTPEQRAVWLEDVRAVTRRHFGPHPAKRPTGFSEPSLNAALSAQIP